MNITKIKMYGVIAGLFFLLPLHTVAQTNPGHRTDSVGNLMEQLKLLINGQLQEKDARIARLELENGILKHLLDSIESAKVVVPGKFSPALKKALGPDFLQAVSQSSKITGYLLIPKEQDKDKMNTPGYFLGYQVLDSVKAGLPIKQSLLNEESYELSALQKMCAFTPAIAYRFGGKGKTAMMLIGFNCDEFVYYLDKRRLGKFSLEKMHEKQIQFAQKAFPAAKSLEGLK